MDEELKSIGGHGLLHTAKRELFILHLAPLLHCLDNQRLVENSVVSLVSAPSALPTVALVPGLVPESADLACAGRVVGLACSAALARPSTLLLPRLRDRPMRGVAPKRGLRGLLVDGGCGVDGNGARVGIGGGGIAPPSSAEKS
eukprot:226135-Prymnesium_polylepis.2